MSAPDPRHTLARPGVASRALEGVVPAARYVATRRLSVTAPSAALFRAATAASERLDELLRGETFDALECEGEFFWGQARRDGYVGFVHAAELAPVGEPPTHWVRAIRAYAFAEPHYKGPARGPFSINALARIDAEAGEYLRADDGAWFWRGHLAPIGDCASDPATVAERLAGAPYLWGGRTSLGLDCSGLVQQALYACGRACPRESDQQAALGCEIGRADLGRGDLVGWPGHIGLMLDASRLVHATSFHMAVVVEPLEAVVARVGEPTALRRL